VKSETLREESAAVKHQDFRRASWMNNRWIAAWEIVSVTSSFFIAAWIAMPFAGSAMWLKLFPIGCALVFIIISHHERCETRRAIGWRFDNFGRAARLLATPMCAGACLILIIGWLRGSLHFDKVAIWQWSLWLPAWGLLQHYVLQGFINRRAQIVCGGANMQSVLVVAVIFALLHLPNLWLMLATFAGGAMWAFVYQRAPNLFALGISHGLMSMLLASAVSPATLNNLRVGFRYFN
jgi:membrane protease YdiL (CAAX protease family)